MAACALLVNVFHFRQAAEVLVLHSHSVAACSRPIARMMLSANDGMIPVHIQRAAPGFVPAPFALPRLHRLAGWFMSLVEDETPALALVVTQVVQRVPGARVPVELTSKGLLSFCTVREREVLEPLHICIDDEAHIFRLVKRFLHGFPLVIRRAAHKHPHNVLRFLDQAAQPVQLLGSTHC